MNEIKNLIAYPLLTSFIVFLCTALWGNYSARIGEVTFGECVKVGDFSMKHVSISNSSGNFIDGLVLTIPGKVQLKRIESSSTLIVDEISPKNSAGGRIFKIEKIPPERKVDMLIISSLSDDYSVVSNAKSIGFDVVSEGVYKNGVTSFILYSVWTALVVLVISVLFSMLEQKANKRQSLIESAERDKLRASIDSLSIMNRELRASQEDLRRQLVENSKVTARVKHLMNTRLHAYQKEISFWRDVISYCVRSKAAGNEISKMVASRLRTYTTLHNLKSSSLEDFDFESSDFSAENNIVIDKDLPT